MKTNPVLTCCLQPPVWVSALQCLAGLSVIYLLVLSWHQYMETKYCQALIINVIINHPPTQNSTGCFTGNEIIYFLISQPIKHLNSSERSCIFHESIAFWYMISIHTSWVYTDPHDFLLVQYFLISLSLKCHKDAGQTLVVEIYAKW